MMERTPISPMIRTGSGSAHDTRSNLNTATGAASTQLISADYLVHEPVCSGFLLKHCKEQFSEENMLFVVAVDRFRDYFHRDLTAFSNKPWRILDADLNLITPEQEDSDNEDQFLSELRRPEFIEEGKWPSKILNKEAVRTAMLTIWDKFLSDRADYQICIPHSALLMTMRRLRWVHVYGQEVFAEALLDPLSTIQRDIYPRFIQSDHYHTMLETMKLLDKKACAKKLKLPKPRPVIWDRYPAIEIKAGRVLFTLEDLIEDSSLYQEFSTYLERAVADENIKCLRAIAIYKESFGGFDGSKPPIENALLIYRYFVAPLSPYEISVSYLAAKEVLRGLAEPRPELFEGVEKSALGALQTHFASYRSTAAYANLSRTVGSNGRPDNNNDSSRSSVKGSGGDRGGGGGGGVGGRNMSSMTNNGRGAGSDVSIADGSCFSCFPAASSSSSSSSSSPSASSYYRK